MSDDATPSGPVCPLCPTPLTRTQWMSRAWQCLAPYTDHYAAIWHDWELTDPPLDAATARLLMIQRRPEAER